MLKPLTLVVVFLFGAVLSVPARNGSNRLPPRPADEATFRLPNNTIPLRYDIGLTTNLHLPDDNPDKFKFDGSVHIQIRVLETSDYVTVHTKQQDLRLVMIFNDIGKEIPIVERVVDEEREFVIFRVQGYLYKNEQIELLIQYTATLREDNRGFYRSSYLDTEGKRHWLASTQFSAADARHAFPCYDEPQIRAIFGIRLTEHKDYVPISNMDVEKTETWGDLISTTFKDTPLMQTYILGFTVSQFKYIEHEATGEVPQRVYGRPEAISNHEGDFGLNTGVKIMQHMQSYFSLEYPLEKMYQAAVPDFVFSAMENWGLIIYRESRLLYDEQLPSLITKREITGTMAHEYAHMFFGNLVAPRYWYYVWLKEGFATLYDYEFNEALFPETKSRDYMVANAVQYALLRDGTEETRAMTTFVKEPSEIYLASSSFAIYQKGGSILRMFQMALSEETFKKGAVSYIKTKQFDAADSNDLARSIENAAREDNAIPKNVYFKDIIDSWSLKSGYPVVSVTFNDKQQIRLDQSRFSYYPTNGSDDLWYIPVTIATESSPNFERTTPITWFNTESVGISRTEDVKWFLEDWILVNVQEMGYFRVNYADILWVRLSKKLKSDTFEDIHHLNRAQLVDDALNIARTDLLQYYVALQITEYLVKEKEFVPWMSANVGFGFMNRLLSDSGTYELFQAYINELITPLYTDMGLDDQGSSEEFPEKIKRNIAVNWACLSGDESCITGTKTRVEEAITDPTKEPALDVRQAIYCNGLRHANQDLYQAVFDRMQASQDQNYRRVNIQSLGCSVNPEFQAAFLKSTFDKEYREQEKQDVLNAVLMNGGKTGVNTIIDFVMENHAEIEKTFVGVQNPVKTITRSTAEFITSPEMLQKYIKLVGEVEHLITEAEKHTFFRTAQLNIDWVVKNEEDIRQFLIDYSKKKVVAEQYK